MLTRLQLENPKQRNEVFNTFDTQTSTWIVSDLKSKLALQKKGLDRSGFIPEDAVLRASELWKKLFFRAYPETSLISQDLSTHLISVWLEKSEFEWAKTTGAGKKMFEFMTYFAGVLSHPLGFDRMGEWFRANVDSYMRWGEWFLESTKIWSEFKKRKLLPQAWISSCLANDNVEALVDKGYWAKNIILDLGPDLNSFEAEIILQLSRRIDVTVILTGDHTSQYEKLLQPYQVFNVAEVKKATVATLEKANIEVRRFATMLSEVKDATAQAREWIESGILADRIAIVAPNIKPYWRALDQYFVQEGVALRGERGTILSDLPDVGVWISSMRVRAVEVSAEDLEQSLYMGSQNTPFDFDRFRSLYSRIYGDEDLERSIEISKLVKSRPFLGKTTISKKEFIASSLVFWPENGEIVTLEKIISLVFRDGPDQISLPPREWVGYLQNLLCRSDLVSERISRGVHCVGLDSAEDLDVDATIFLGLSDSELRQSQTSRLDHGEIQSIHAQKGFLFPNNDNSRLDFKARWFLKGQKRIVLSFPTTDFNGDTLSPSMFWLEQAVQLRAKNELEKMSIPKVSRWDALQQMDLDSIIKIRAVEGDYAEQLKSRIRADLGEAEDPLFGMNRASHLSASAIEDYLKCPFIFASKRLYKLLDLPDLDLDVDGSTRGRLMHKLFEKLLSNNLESKYSDQQIENILDEARIDIKAEFGDERTWKFLRKRLVELGKRFIDFELEWRRRFPETRTALCEAEVQGFINRKSLEFETEETENAVAFKGYIDRIDIDKSNHVVTLDYKSSAADIRQYNSWLEKNQLQLALYSMAVQKGLTALGPKDVVGSFYYVGRTFDRSYGFRQVDGGEHLLDLDKAGKNKITSAEKSEFFEAVKQKVKVVIEGLEKGEFNPKPFEPDKCLRCQWNQLCRAPHLN